MTTSEVQVSHPEAGIAVVRLNAAERKNALTGAMARDLVDELERVDRDNQIAVAIISGGTEAFCAGAHRDLLSRVGRSEPEAIGDIEQVYAVFDRVRALRPAVIAAVCGPAVGAGLNLALACDVRLIATNAYLRSMFVANQIHPAGGHLRMLRAIGGVSLAMRMAVFDEALNAQAAVAAGLGLGPYAPEDVERVAIELARRAAAQPELAREITCSIAAVAPLDDTAAAAMEGELQARTLRAREMGRPQSLDSARTVE